MEEEQFKELMDKLDDIQADIPNAPDLSELNRKLDKVIAKLGSLENILASIDTNTSR
jgi:hypothetical protein